MTIYVFHSIKIGKSIINSLYIIIQRHNGFIMLQWIILERLKMSLKDLVLLLICQNKFKVSQLSGKILYVITRYQLKYNLTLLLLVNCITFFMLKCHLLTCVGYKIKFFSYLRGRKDRRISYTLLL